MRKPVGALSREDREPKSVLKSGAVSRFSTSLCLHEIFEKQAALTPDGIAVVFDRNRLTYRELNERSNQLAHHLIGLGVGPEVLVGVFLERSLDLVCTLLGILKAGGAYVPLDPNTPAERLSFILQDTQTPVLVTEESLVSKLPENQAKLVVVEAVGKNSAKENPKAAIKPENLAYVIYTSGSTGKPKGVMVSHFNVVRLFEATDAWFQFNANDVWTLFHSYAFDFSVWELWGALLCGGKLVVVPYWTSRSPADFYELLLKEQVTVLNQTPLAFRQLMHAEEVVWEKQRELQLRYVIFGGEALEFKSLLPWMKRHGDKRPQLVNMYGITETTVHVTYRPLSATDVEAGAASVIGQEIPDLELHLLDPQQKPVAVGVEGEIYVGGAGVARGYLNRAELTAQRFIADPFRPGSGATLYRSGDLARRLPNGDIEYLGRMDDQVKIRGHRIELGEIESVLSQHADVKQAAVLARAEASAEKRLIAFVMPRELGKDLSYECRAFLKEKLPDYMVPSTFVMLESFPLTANGKLDRRALPDTSTQVAAAEVSLGAAQHSTGDTEERLLVLWRGILGAQEVSAKDNFFDSGGDSLSVAAFQIRIAQVLGIQLPITVLFEFPSVSLLAAHIKGNAKAEPALANAQNRAQKAAAARKQAAGRRA